MHVSSVYFAQGKLFLFDGRVNYRHLRDILNSLISVLHVSRRRVTLCIESFKSEKRRSQNSTDQ